MIEHARPSKESYYLDIARTVSQRSTCLRKHWGAVIVKDDVIVSTGYNGAPRGCTNCTDKGVCWRAEHNIPRGTRYELCAANGVHAEGNAIIAAARERMIGSTMYIYGWDVERREMVHNPDSCQMCKRMIINAGIDEVIFALPKETVAPDRPADMEYVFTVRKTKDWIREGAVEPSVDGY